MNIMAERASLPTASVPQWRTEHRLRATNGRSARDALIAASRDGGLVYGVVNAYTQHNQEAAGPRVRLRLHVGLQGTRRTLEFKEPSRIGATRKRCFSFCSSDLDESAADSLCRAEAELRLALIDDETDLPVSLPPRQDTSEWANGRLQVVAIVSFVRTSLWWSEHSRGYCR